MRTAKVQTSMRIRAVWYGYSLFVALYNNVHWFWRRATKAFIRLIRACVVRKLHKGPFPYFTRINYCLNYMSHTVRKRTFWHVRPKKTQISLCNCAVWSEFPLSTRRHFAPLAIQNAHNEDSNQTAWMRRLIWIFAGRTCPKVRFLTLRLV